jgi:hypothetical protein
MPDPCREPSKLARSRRSVTKAAAMLIGALPGLALISCKASARPVPSTATARKCFLRGTRIRTLTGYRPVECRSVGYVLSTVFSGPAPIREIRHFRHERKVAMSHGC